MAEDTKLDLELITPEQMQLVIAEGVRRGIIPVDESREVMSIGTQAKASMPKTPGGKEQVLQQEGYQTFVAPDKSLYVKKPDEAEYYPLNQPGPTGADIGAMLGPSMPDIGGMIGGAPGAAIGGALGLIAGILG